MKIASSRTTSIDLPDLTQLPDKFKFILATEYHRLVHLHRRYRREVVVITTRPIPVELIQPGGAFSGLWDTRTSTLMPIHQQIVDCITKGIPLDYDSFALALRRDYGVYNLEVQQVLNILTAPGLLPDGECPQMQHPSNLRNSSQPLYPRAVRLWWPAIPC